MAVILIFLLFSRCNSDTSTSESSEVFTLVEHLYAGTGGVTVGNDGTIYVSDFGPWLSGLNNLNPGNRVYKVSPEGKVQEWVRGIFGASGSKIDDEGNFYQSNVQRGWVSKISPQGILDTTFITGMTSPVGIQIDKEGNLYVNNCGAHKIVRVNKDGIKTDFCSDSLLNCPNGLTKDESGNFYVSNFYDGNLIKITATREASLLVSIPGNNNGHVLYHDNFLYVVARGNHQIYKVSLTGDVNLWAGNGTRGRVNSTRLNSSFSFPNDIDVSPDGRYMYVNEISDTISDHRLLTPTTLRRIIME
ncbi:MAG: hypothetical protein HKN68_21865 [Saprospiraceae bacterium]|nr:hypothetical protein [Saprospiraceae bacterium]